MEKRTIAIIGHGYVGQAIEAYFKEKFTIVIYDPAKGQSDCEAVQKAQLAVVCVPTNMREDGSVDLSLIEETFAWLKTESIVIKSTVPPGTTALLAQKFDLEDCLVFSPEYIGEGGYPMPYWEDVPHPTDMKQHTYFIFGGSARAREKVIPFFERVSGPYAKYIQTDSTTAELVKYTANTWIATKVTFCNELFDIAKTFGVDYRILRELWLLDGRSTPAHTLVYGESRGFGGKCIPKDTAGLVKAAEQKGYDAQLLKSVLATNAAFRKQPKD